MQFEDEYEPDFKPVVSPKLRNEVHQRLKSTTKIIINEKTDDEGARKINAINLHTKYNQYPPESVDQIAEAVAGIMHIAWQTQEEDEDGDVEPMRFTIIFEHWETKAAGKPKRVRSQFTYTYHADNHEQFTEVNADFYDPRDRLIELQNTHIAMQQSMLLESHQTLLGAVGNFSQGANAGAQVMRDAVPLFIAGMQAQLNAATLQFSAKRAETEAAESGKKLRDVMKMASPYVGLLGGQLMGKFMGADTQAWANVAAQQAQGAAGGSPAAGVPQTPAADGGGEGASPSVAYATVSATDVSATDASAQASDDAYAPPPEGQQLSAFAYGFGQNLRPEQHQAFNRILTKKQVAAFYDLFCASDDAGAYQAYQRLIAEAASKLGDLKTVLDAQQLEWFTMFMTKAAEYGAVHGG